MQKNILKTSLFAIIIFLILYSFYSKINLIEKRLSDFELIKTNNLGKWPTWIYLSILSIKINNVELSI